MAIALVGVVALLAPNAAQAAPVPNVAVSFGNPPAPNTIAGDETEYRFTFTAQNGLNSVPGTAVIINAAGAPPFASGTIFPENALHHEEGAFYTIGSVTDPTPLNVVVADVILQNGGQTVAIPTAFTGVNAAIGETVIVTIGFNSEHKVKNRPTPCDDCRFALDTNMPGDDFGLSNAFDVVLGPGDLLHVANGGDDQATTVGSAFGQVLQAKLVDGSGNPVQGATVTFTAPGTGPSGTFAGGTNGGLTFEDETDANGIAMSSVLTANDQVGAWTATAQSDVANVNSVSFSLENDPGPPDDAVLELSPNVIQGNGVSTSQATVTVSDEFGNRVGPGQTVTITSTGDQEISNPAELSDGRYRATIRSTPESGNFTITANVAEGTSPSDSEILFQTQDATAPRAEIRDHPRSKFRRARARFTFDPGGADVAFSQCKLDGRPFRNCSSPKSYRVRVGKHRFRVRSTDFAGNTGPADLVRFERIRRRR